MYVLNLVIGVVVRLTFVRVVNIYFDLIVLFMFLSSIFIHIHFEMLNSVFIVCG